MCRLVLNLTLHTGRHARSQWKRSVPAGLLAETNGCSVVKSTHAFVIVLVQLLVMLTKLQDVDKKADVVAEAMAALQREEAAKEDALQQVAAMQAALQRAQV